MCFPFLQAESQLCVFLFFKLSRSAAAASASLAMKAFDDFATEIDIRVAHINAQVGMGAPLEEVAGEQARALLNTFSQLDGIGLAVVTDVSNHLQASGVWDRTQLAAFSACLRANVRRDL